MFDAEHSGVPTVRMFVSFVRVGRRDRDAVLGILLRNLLDHLLLFFFDGVLLKERDTWLWKELENVFVVEKSG